MSELTIIDYESETTSKFIEKKWDRLNIRESDREDYKRLLFDDSPFAGKDNKDIFMMAMITGYIHKNRIKLDKKFGFFRYDNFSQVEKVILKSIAVAEEGNLIDADDKEKIFTIAEEYAAGGIKLLKDEVFSCDYGSYPKRLESTIREEFDNYKAKISRID